MKLLITGINGFVGARLRVAALAAGHQVVGIVRRVVDISTHENLHIEQLDLTNRQRVLEIIQQAQPDVVLHVAACIPQTVDDPLPSFFDNNTAATLNILEGSQASNVGRVVFSSTMSVYGLPEYLPVDEDHPARPMAAYGLSKLQAEQIAQLYTKYSDMRVTVLRYSGIYGAGQKGGAVPAFIRRCLANEPISLHSEGRPSSDFVWVEDVVQANLYALEPNTGPKFELLNIGSGIEYSIRELAETVKRLTTSNSKITLSQAPSPRDFRFAYDISKARVTLGYHPTDPEVSLARCIEQWKASEW